MQDLDFNPARLPTEVLEAVGLMAQCSAYAEYVIEQGIGGCIGTDIEYTAAIVTHMASQQRDNALRAAAEIRVDGIDDLDRLDDLLDALNKALKPRNTYVHNSVCRDKATGKVWIATASARGSVEVSLIPFDVKMVQVECGRILTAANALYDFLSKKNLLATIPPESRPRGHKLKAARKARRKGIIAGKRKI